MLGKPTPLDQKLAELLQKAKKRQITDAELIAQRKSWVKGEIMLENPSMTAEEFEALWLKLPAYYR